MKPSRRSPATSGGASSPPRPWSRKEKPSAYNCPSRPRAWPFENSVDERLDVGRDGIFGEAGLADAGLDDAGLFDTEFHRAALGVLDGLGDVHRHRADLGVRHQVARAQYLTQATDDTHHVRGGDAAVEVDLAGRDFGGEFLGTHQVGASLLGLFRLGALGEHRDAEQAAVPDGSRGTTPRTIWSAARIDAEIDGEFDGFIELGAGAPLISFTASLTV